MENPSDSDKLDITSLQDNRSVELMLEEFQHNSENWRHLDNRFEHLVNYYITIVAAVVAAFGAIFSAFGNVDLGQLAAVYMFVAPFLVVYGHFVGRRASSTVILQVRHLNSMNLVRRYFWEYDKDIELYLGRYKTASGLKDVPLVRVPNDEFKHLEPSWHDKTVHATYVVNAFLTYLWLSILFHWLAVFTHLHRNEIGRYIDIAASSFIIVVLLFIYLKRRYDNWKLNLRDERK